MFKYYKLKVEFYEKLYIVKNYVKMLRNVFNFRYICLLKVDWD